MVTQSQQDLTCTACGCVCDDLRASVQNQRITAVDRACVLAEPWLLGQSDKGAPATIGGATCSTESAVAEAADILNKSQSPLIYGLAGSSTEGQRAAVRLADRLGATIDTAASTCHAPSIIALQQVGESTSSLGEVKNRSDLIVYWGCDPEVSHPRHMERFVDAPGLFVPGGRSDRHVVVIDIEKTPSAQRADSFIRVEKGTDFELIWALRALLGGTHLPDRQYAGIPRQTIADLAERLKNANYGAVFFGLGLTRGVVPHGTVEALLRLVRDLNDHTRCVVRRMRLPGDVAGADNVLCWQTGFPFSVNLARGYPRYNPGEYTAGVLLERGEVDALVLVGSKFAKHLSPQAKRQLKTIPSIVIDPPSGERYSDASVHFTTGIYGIHHPGTAYRMDDVPLPLHQVLHHRLPSDHEILSAIGSALVADKASQPTIT